jgi:hypothetical protein
VPLVISSIARLEGSSAEDTVEGKKKKTLTSFSQKMSPAFFLSSPSSYKHYFTSSSFACDPEKFSSFFPQHAWPKFQ